MKKVLLVGLLGSALLLSGCDTDIEKVAQPFKEYKIIENSTVNMIENKILSREAITYHLDETRSSGHIIEFTKIGDYAKGTMRVLGNISNYGMDELNKDRYTKIKTDIVTYNIEFEYSYKTNRMSWSSGFPYKR